MKEENREFFEMISSGLTIGLFLAGLIALLPYDRVLHPNVWGYNSLCTFSPMSSFLLWGIAGFLAFKPDRKKRRQWVKKSFYYASILLFAATSIYCVYLLSLAVLSWESESFSEIAISQLPDGTYLGQSSNIGKKVVLKVTVEEGRMKHIEVLNQGYASTIGEKAFQYLPEKIILAQSPKVDAISGATSSSKQIKSAVYNALSPKNKGQKANGTPEKK